MSNAKAEKLNLIGDGRFDSPGNSATFGTYTFMNSDNNEILDFFIAHVRNAGNSQRMESYAFTRVMKALIDVGISIASITTDRHKSIRKLLREKYPDILHQFDIWHFAKNISKELHKKAKLKKNKPLQPWIRSIINHFWWSCATCGKDEDVLREKWISVLNHVADQHEWEGCSKYHRCAHDQLTQKRKWLRKGSPAHEVLKAVVLDGTKIKDLKHLTHFMHSGELEVFHSLYNVYCPKRIAFSYEGMYARTQLAVIDHNSGIAREQAQTKTGVLRYKTVSSKVSDNWVAKKIMIEKDKSFIQDILNTIWDVSKLNLAHVILEKTPKNISTVEYPGKDVVVQRHMSRFSM